MKVLLFDNYDSFTYNLLHILKELGAEVEVHRNDKISLDEVNVLTRSFCHPVRAFRRRQASCCR